MNALLSRLLGLALAAVVVLPVAASAADITVSGAWIRATPGGAKVAGGFLEIANAGAAADRLTGGTIDAAGRVEVHEMTMDGDVMRMRELADGLEIPAGGAVSLRPGSFHLMLMDLARPLKEGETVTGTLRFEKAGELPVTFMVEAIGAKGPKGGMGHGEHGGMQHHGDAPAN